MPYKSLAVNRNYQRQWVAERRATYFTDKACALCQSTISLELHHRNPADKLSHGIWSWSLARRDAELLKCIVLCAKCHKKITALDHATRAAMNGSSKPFASNPARNVFWDKKRRGWDVYFRPNDKTIRVGLFRNLSTAILSAEKFRSAQAKHFGRDRIRNTIACLSQFSLFPNPLTETPSCKQNQQQPQYR